MFYIYYRRTLNIFMYFSFIVFFFL